MVIRDRLNHSINYSAEKSLLLSHKYINRLSIKSVLTYASH